jgi:hypothetical protein
MQWYVAPIHVSHRYRVEPDKYVRGRECYSEGTSVTSDIMKTGVRVQLADGYGFKRRMCSSKPIYKLTNQPVNQLTSLLHF